ncbi:MAG: penicillin-binding protein activator, partial [Steroidobacteraceae bacterium]
LAPLDDWGTRVLAAFKDELAAGGGTLLDTARFDPALSDFAPVITDVLRIDDSNDRLQRLESVVGSKLEFQPRRRGDIDFIFEASATAPTARLLRTQLRFYFAGDVPAYATSDSFEPDPSANEDLGGLAFPDMPWMLGSGLAESVHAAATAAWPVEGPQLDRLFAFGFDAYRLLGALRTTPAGGAISVEGLTGILTLDADRRVHRQLEWAQLRDGQPRLLPPPAPTETPAVTPGAGPAPAPASTPAPTAASTPPQAPSTQTPVPTAIPH